MKKQNYHLRTRLTALLLALICVLGLFPTTAFAASDTITLKEFGHSGVAYQSAALGRCTLHEMNFTNGNQTTTGFCGTKGGGMGTSLQGQTWGNKRSISDPTVETMMAYYYAHSTGVFTDEAEALGVADVWGPGYRWYMNAWVQACIWRYQQGSMSDPVTACAEELMAVYNTLEGTHYTSIDQKQGENSFRDRTQFILDLGSQGVWGKCTVYEYTFTGAGSSSHPAGTVQKIILGDLTVEHIEQEEYVLIVKKVDATNPSKGLPGAGFHIESTNGSYSKDVVTGQNGTYRISGLSAATYAVTETSAPEGYQIDSATPQYVTLPSNGNNTVTVTFRDSTTITGEGSIRKVDADNPTRGLAGAVIKITGVDNSFTGTYITGEGGYLTDVPWDSMPIGSFVAEEVTPPEGFSKSPDQSKVKQSFHWNGKDDVALVFENDSKVKIRLVKLDDSNNPLPGAVFNILRDGQIIGSEATKEDGSITVTDVTEALYAFVEVSAPSPWAKLDDPVIVHVDQADINGGETITVSAADKRLPNLTILKRDKQTGDVIPDTHFEIKGIHYGFHDDVTTGADGKAVLTGIPVDSYEVSEKSVPDPWVVGDEPTQTIWLGAGDDQQLIFDNLKQPLLTLKKIDADTKEPIPGTVLRVEAINGDYQDDWTTGADGKVTKYVTPGTFRVTEISVPSPWYLPDKDADRVQTINLNAGDVKELVFRNRKEPQITIYKEDSVAGAPIEGAKFHVTYTSNGEASDAPASADYGYLFTDANGEIKLHEQGKKLYPGEFTITEVAPAPGFQMKEPSTQTVILHGNESKTVTFQNEPLNAIIVEKYDSVTHEALPGCTFQLRFLGGTSGTGGTVIGQKVTGKNGTCIWTGLTAGTYVCEEVDPADGYSIINSSETVYLADSGEQSVVTVRFDNSPDGNLLVRKVCSVNPSITLQDAEFKIMYADGTLIGDSNGIYRSDENGEVRISGLKPGKSVVVTEVRAPDGFILDTQSQTIQIKEGRTVTLTFKNQPRGKLIIQKRDSISGQPLPGAQFRLTTAAGCEVGLDGVIGTATLTQNGIFTTDSNGEIRVSNLAPGALILTEVKAPAGYVIDNPSTNVMIGPNGDTQTVIVTNTPKGGLVVEKYDKITKEPLAGARFKIVYSNGELLPDNEGLTSSNGFYTTDQNGQIVISKVLPGTLVVAEDKAPDFYQKDPTPQTVVVNAADTQTLRFYDDPLCTLTILKRDAVTHKPLSGGQFLVRYSDGHVIGPNNGLYTTGTDGTVTVSGLKPNATVVVSEQKAPKGYILDQTPKNIVVRPGVANGLIFDDQPGTTLIIQKFIEGTENEPLSGVAFKVTDGAGAAVGPDDGTYYTDKAGEIVLSGIEPGTTVKAREIKTVDGFVLDGTPQDILIKGGEVQRLTFWNKRAGTLLIEKRDSVTKAPLSGAQFKVLYADGRVVDTEGGKLSSNGVYFTDSNGQIKITNVVGTLVVTEEKCPEGYVMGSHDKSQTVVVNPQDTQTLRFYNDPMCSLTLTKLDSVTGKPVPNTEFTVKDGDGNIIGRYVTGKDGTVVVTDLIPNSTVVVSESRVPDGYVLNTTPKTIIVKNGDRNSWTSGGSSSSSGGSSNGNSGGNGNDLTFENDPKMTLTIHKYIEGTANEPLAGVAFKVTDGSGKEIGPTNGIYYTDKSGDITLEGLEPGTTVIAREIKTVEGFVLDGTPQTIKVEAGKALSMTFWNKRDCSLTILKQSTNKEPLTGAVFHVTDEDGAAIGTNNGRYTSDRNGLITITGLQPGQVLVVTEEKAPNGYVRDMTPKTIKIKQGVANSLIFENAHAGSLVINKRSSADKKTPLEGVCFKITTSSGEFLPDENGKISSNGLYYTDENGQIVLKSVVGTLVVTEQSTIDGYTIHEANRTQTVEIKPDDTQTIYFYNDPLCSLTLKKLDSVTGKPVPNTEFTVKDGDGNIFGRYVTGKDGTVVVTGLIPNSTVVVSESRVPEGYVLNTTPKTIVVKSGSGNSWISGGSSSSSNGNSGGNDLTFENDPKMTLTIHKYIEGTANEPLAGVAFKVVDGSGKPLNPDGGIYYTNNAGEIVLDGLEPGTTITAQEIKTVDGYVLDGRPQSITIEAGKSQNLSFWNKKAGSLTIRKLDKQTGKPLAGVEFEMIYSEGGYVDTDNGHLSSKGLYTTDDHGEIHISGIVGTVVVKETRPLPGYTIEPGRESQTVTVNPQETQTLTFFNVPSNTLTIQKYAEGSDNEPLAGVEFLVTDSTGAVVGPNNGYYTTDKDGRISIPGLTPGTTVTVKETKTLDGYILDSQPQSILIKEGEAQTLTFRNKKAGGLIINKIDASTKKPLAGVKFKITYADGSNVDLDGGKISSNGLYTTDTLGQIKIPGIVGTVIVEEVETLPGYVIDPNAKSQTVQVNPNDTQTITFVNVPVGGLELIKVSASDKTQRIPNVKFEIRKMDGGLVTTVTTDSTGRIHVDLDAGDYYAVEIETGKGFKIDETPQYFTVKDGETTTLTVTNKALSGIQIHKIDSVTKKGIYGVTFLLYDSTNKPIGQYTSDDQGYVYIEDITEAGRYYLKEQENPGYLVDTQMKTVYVKPGEVTLVEWENTAITGQIQITKTSEDYNSMNGWPAGTPIPGTVFEIYDRVNNLVDTIRTDKNGLASSRPLPLGRYKVVESQSAEFYGLDKTPMEAEIEFSGQIVRLAMTNKALYTNVSINKRGYAQVMPGQAIRYDFTGIANNSTTALSSFYWRDTLPAALRLDKIVTGTYNVQGNYKIVYKTNLSGETYRVIDDNVSTMKNSVVTASPAALGLASGEYVTEVMFVFGVVPSNFRQVEAPQIHCNVVSWLKGGAQFVNQADVGGVHNEQWIMATDRWVTTVYKPVKPSKPLPRTGY